MIPPGPVVALAPEQVVDAVWGLLLPGHAPSAATRSALVDYASDGGRNQSLFDAKTPGLTALILSAPEYQLA